MGAIEYDNASNSELLIRHVRAVFCEQDDPEYLTTAKLLDGLNFPDDWPWGTWSRGKPMNAHALGRMLRPFGLRSKAQKVEGKALKVYELAPLLRNRWGAGGGSNRYSATDGVKDLNAKEKTGLRIAPETKVGNPKAQPRTA